jgi:hypothetical protein
VTRRISLPIDGATETECGACIHLDGSYCNVYALALLSRAPRAIRRAPECLAAEREHAAMERDARLGKAVREVATPEQLYHAKEAVRRMQADSIAQHGGSVGSAMVVESCRWGMEMLDAIAAALRAEEEVPRG